jgi:hypothetical protein
MGAAVFVASPSDEQGGRAAPESQRERRYAKNKGHGCQWCFSVFFVSAGQLDSDSWS